MNVDEALLLADDAYKPAPYTVFSGHLDALQVLAAEVRRQHAEIQSINKDAERYRYLRNRTPIDVLDRFGRAAGVWVDMEGDDGRLVLLTGIDADNEIDAAFKDQGEPK